MKKIYNILFLLLLASCEREVAFPTDNEGRVFVRGIIGENCDNRIIVNVSQPAFGERKISAEDVALCLEADGKTISLERDPEYAGYEGEISYMVTDEIVAGQTLKLAASADGVPDVRAFTSVPAPLKNIAVTSRIAEVYKEMNAHQTISDTQTLREFRITTSGVSDDEDNFYGVQVLKRAVYDTLGPVPDDIWKTYAEKSCVAEYEDLYVNAGYSEGIGVSSAEVEISVDFEGGDMRVFSPHRDDKDQIGTVYIKPYARHRVYSSYKYTTDGAHIIEFEITEAYEYNIKVFCLSPEIYHFLKARYMIDWTDIPVHLGFTPVTYTYTNVEGGIGVFGGASAYESGWIRLE